MLSTAPEKSKKLLEKSALSEHQQQAVTHIYEQPQTLLVAKMGAGKTVVALTAIAELMQDGCVNKILVIAPVKVCNEVWRQEASKWAHLHQLQIAAATGTPAQREKAFASAAQIVLINFENLIWFFDKYGKTHGFDGFVIDELSRFKSSGGAIFRKMRRYFNSFSWRVGMTGTPVSENFEGVYSQALILDNGYSFGKNKQRFLETYFYSIDFERRQWELRYGAAKTILERLEGLMLVLPDYRDALPPIEYITHEFELDNFSREYYNEFKRNSLIDIGGTEFVAVNEAVATGKLAQLASGFLYDPDTGHSVELSRNRLNVLIDILRKTTGPVIVAYWYKHDRDLIAAALGDLCEVLGAGVTAKNTGRIVERWNSGTLPILLLHPRSAGHGLNLQAGGSEIIWYTPQWSRDLWEQTNARLWRRGQENAVQVHSIIAAKTIDVIIDQRVEDKAKFDALLQAHIQG